MPARGRTDVNAAGAPGSPRTGTLFLAAAWLLLLGCVALVGWLVHTSPPAEPPVRTAVLHTGDLPDPPAPVARVLAEAIDPRVHQLAARDTGAGAASQRASQGPTSADAAMTVPGIAAPMPRTAGKADTGTAAPATSDRSAAADADTPRVQLATRTAGTSPDRVPARQSIATAEPSAGPLPPPVPRSVIGPVTRDAAQEAAGRYSVQVGAFRQRQNAVARAARLSEAGYDVRIVHALATQSRLYMVRLGSFDARPAAMAYARRLARDVEVETWPVRN